MGYRDKPTDPMTTWWLRVYIILFYAEKKKVESNIILEF